MTNAKARRTPQPPLVRCQDLPRSGTARAPRRWAITAADYAGKPVIAIINTWSDINPCHTHFKRAEEVKRGVWQNRRLSGRDAGVVAVRAVPEADHHALSQPAGDGDGGAAKSYPADGARADGRAATRPRQALVMGAVSMNLPTIFCRRPDAAR